jgi:anhydro-N-acetylmuramic acid kinase
MKLAENVSAMKSKLFRAIGLMSGTSIDGIDAALVETDGFGHVRPLAFVPYSYDSGFRARLRKLFGKQENAANPEIAVIERELTELHADIVKKLLEQVNGGGSAVDLIGFHGQTLWHHPTEGVTFQIGDGALLAKETGIPVVNDFRSADIKAGGQGAPLVPLYHRALAAGLPKPLAILNVGGVSNITWIGGEGDEDILAFDVGPGNAPLDDWVLHHTGQAFDAYGVLAAEGIVRLDLIDKLMKHPFFSKKPPKSLDRNAFKNLVPDDLRPADGAATITKMIAHGVAKSFDFLPKKPLRLYVAGGGRLNNTFMRWLRDLLGIPVSPVDELGWSGDALEAEAFAYLAVRSHLGLPLSVPGTTGVKVPVTGGKFYKP